MKKLKMLLLPLLAIALLLQGCAISKSAVFEEDLSYDGLTAIQIASATNGKGKEINKAIDGDLKSSYKSASKEGYIELEFEEKTEFDTVILREAGWKINAFHIEIAEEYDGEEYFYTIYKQDAVEDIRVCSFDAVTAKKARIVVDDAAAPFAISEISVYKSNKLEKTMRVTGYLRTYDLARDSYNDPESNFYLDPEYFSVINQVILFSGFKMTDDGGIALEDYLQGGEFESYYKRLKEEIIKDSNTDILLTLGVSKAPSKSMVDNREESIKNIIDFLLKYDFKGVSFDWEFPSADEYGFFGDFLIELNKALDEHGLLLSCAFYSWGINLSDEAIKSIDQIEIMGYDIYDRVGNNAGFIGSCVQPIKYFLDKGVSKEAISLGVPIFGRTIDSENVWRDYDLYELRKFDNIFYDSSEDEIIYFNSAQMIEDKVAYAVMADVGGIMLFHIKNDLPFENENSIIRTIGKTIDKYTAKECDYEAE